MPIGRWENQNNLDIILLDCSTFPQFDSNALPFIHQHLSTLSPMLPVPVTSLSYVLYTSGSTGNPKGVMLGHQSVIRLVKKTNFIDFKPGDRILQTGALEFDTSTFEIWGALLNGLSLYLVPKENILNPVILKRLIASNRITTMWMTSPLFNQIVQSDILIFTGLRNQLVGGDVLSPFHINQLKRQFPRLNIINGYGPAENTTFSTTFLIDKEYQKNIPIGRPVANSTVYILNRNNQLQPIGSAGELWVGGSGVARGYLNNPELTAEKFDHDLLNLLDSHDFEAPFGQVINASGKGESNQETRINQKLLRGPGAVFSKRAPGRRRRKIYQTGDWAHWHWDENIEFLGRID